ncbi:hypothetical protein P3T76_014874 [Phytophthora citrophthora]|uniref:RxLR effector PexRD54 WY domain-containing protein n=1 Tax=Phytophthora citrophthora TaxID=4793 RepID=A0AAD9G0G8_9STRA|nr:hypothetical protein P3T76_014874 [Phytophthora citrophthora]
MRRSVAKVLVAIAFVVTCSAEAQYQEYQKTKLDPLALTLSRPDGLPRKRSLRSDKYAGNEERAAGASALQSLIKAVANVDDVETWLKRDSTTNMVFKALKLQKAGDNLLDNPQLATLMRYLRLFNEANPTKKTSLVATLTTYYGNRGLTKIIEAGLASTSKKTVATAKHLQTEQIQYWMAHGRSPESVFGVLKLDKFLPLTWISSDLFEKPGLRTWIRYLDDFNAENPKQKTTLISILSKRYNDKTLANMLITANKAESTSSIAKRIQAEQTLVWLQTGKKPSDIFTLLELDKAGDSLFQNPLFSAWIKYADDFRFRYSRSELATMSTLISHYSDEAVAKMIVKASEDPNTKMLAKRLQSELQRDWRVSRQSPNDVFIMMNLDRTLDKLLENPLFDIWYQYGLYVKRMNRKNANWNPIAALMRIYGSEKELFDMLMAALKEPRTKEMATKLLHVPY